MGVSPIQGGRPHVPAQATAVTFLQEFDARLDRIDELRGVLTTITSTLRSAAECRSCQLLQSEEDPHRFIVLAVWDSREAQEQALHRIPSDGLRKAMTLVADLPRGGVWTDHF
jgi:quinol monooxygenase YgiN